MLVLFSIMAVTNAAAILFFALRYAIKTIHEKKIHQDYLHSHSGELQLSL